MAKVKDPVSGGTHALGAIVSIVGLVFLIIWAARFGEGAWDVVSFTIFGVGLLLLYIFSALYHLLNLKEKATNVMRKFDHIMIYVLIAATYTPIVLGPLRTLGGWGWSIFGVIWGLAVLRNNSYCCLVKSTKMAYNFYLYSNGMGCNNCCSTNA